MKRLIIDHLMTRMAASIAIETLVVNEDHAEQDARGQRAARYNPTFED